VWGCGRNDFNREHVIGSQIVKTLNLPMPVQVHYGPLAGTEAQTLEVVLRRRVCKTCNHGWMRKLDNEMMRFMGPVFTASEVVTLPPGSQRILGRWIVKVGLLMELYLHDLSVTQPRVFPKLDNTLPTANFQYLYKRQQVPPHAEIWIGQLAPNAPRHAFSSFGGGVMNIVGSENGLAKVEQGGYFSMFILGDVLFRLVDYDVDYGGPRVLAQPDLEALVKVGPPTVERLRWPPAHQITVEDIAQLSKPTAPWAK
jgi:hypothetical protein